LKKRHTSLVKFSGADDPDYLLFVKRLKNEIGTNVRENVHKKWEKYDTSKALQSMRSELVLLILTYSGTGGNIGLRLNNFHEVPSVIPHGARMVTRLEQVKRVQDELSEISKTGRMAIVTVCGRAGVGKTTLMRACSHHAREEGRFVFWLNAESLQTITTGYLKLGQHIFDSYRSKLRYDEKTELERAEVRLRSELGLPDVEQLLNKQDFNDMDPIRAKSAIRAAKDWLLRDGNRWLLVYENVGDSFDLLEFLPLTLQGQMVLITDDKKKCPWAPREIAVQDWDEGEAIDLLAKHSGFFHPLSESDRKYPHNP
jgi:GTPase SAR1 family protein